MKTEKYRDTREDSNNEGNVFRVLSALITSEVPVGRTNIYSHHLGWQQRAITTNNNDEGGEEAEDPVGWQPSRTELVGDDSWPCVIL